MSKSRTINQMFDEKIEQVLIRISDKLDIETPDDDKDDMPVVSENVRDTLDGEGNVTGSVVERKSELVRSDIHNDIQDLKDIVTIKNDYNAQRSDMASTIVRAGCALASVALMLTFEISHSITTKSLGFMPKPKI